MKRLFEEAGEVLIFGVAVVITTCWLGFETIRSMWGNRHE